MPPARPFSCRECSRAFTRSENLERHKRTHHDIANAPRFNCPTCSAQFTRKDVCKRHSVNCAHRGTLAMALEEQPTTPVSVGGHIVSAEQVPRLGNTIMPQHDISGNPHYLGAHHQYMTEDPADWAQPVSPTDILPAEVIALHIQSYLNYFHPSLPILHNSTLLAHSTPPILSKIVVAIGCLYSARRNNLHQDHEDLQLSRNLWKSGCFELGKYVDEDHRRLRVAWVLQSWILYIVYGTFNGDEQGISKARNMYRFMTDAIRDFELLHQKSIFPPRSAWDAELGLSVPPDEVHRRWRLFIDQESIKLALYAFYYLDHHLFASLNMRPIISALEFEWDLPLAASLWEAENTTDWWHAVLQRQLLIESSRRDLSMLDEEVQFISIMVATQFLLSKTASSRLLTTLSSSPFTTLCIVANIENLVRDFTRCYYQLPPALADPSPFHVLTQVQNAQVSTALDLISSVINDSPCASCDTKCKSLWHAVRMGCLSIKISLCKPDDLLVGGIIEGNPAAGLATSVHLSLGNYVSTRRSGLGSRRKTIVEDGFVAILDDMMRAVHEMGYSSVLPPWEAPWTTIQGFKILIILWQALRFSIAELQSQVCAGGTAERYTKIYDPAKTVVHAIITALDMYDPHEHHISHDSLSTLEGLDEVDQLENQYIQWMKQICDRRDVWNIGNAMGQVLDEISALGGQSGS